MPGLETQFLRFENPTEDLIDDYYMGAALRYMFTRGRSYFAIGVMKNIAQSNDSPTLVMDIFSYAFGKDFYPRYFGRGQNTFFNPFSGFEIGGIVFTSEENISHDFTFEPHIGIELFKNQYIILDTRIGYIFPINALKIESHRGLKHYFSLNFVF